MYIRTHLSRIEIQFMICFSVISFYTGLFEIFLGNFQARLAEENLSFHVAELYKKYDIYK
ncbi:hypothetical protein PFMG_01591 [Plasmodium falciparum IGH-CR14]|uniref:Uncharacterized protein n=1 Tax=Plasmodium falciparum IGH-CR14 TaxID=580059 RepID=A0A0L1I7C3_PLAFA|nr:hypothetical protein PFMG_01591 [Plasmodium falciparum IGH-CR14]